MENLFILAQVRRKAMQICDSGKISSITYIFATKLFSTASAQLAVLGEQLCYTIKDILKWKIG